MDFLYCLVCLREILLHKKNQNMEEIQGGHCPCSKMQGGQPTTLPPPCRAPACDVCDPESTPVAQYDSYLIKNSRNKQDRGGSEKKRCSQSETLHYHQHLSRPDIPMPRVWKSAAGPNWTNYPPPHPQGQPNMTSSSSKTLWSSSDTMDEKQVSCLFWLATLTCRTIRQSLLFHVCFVPNDPSPQSV